jgi:hypothetical protein
MVTWFFDSRNLVAKNDRNEIICKWQVRSEMGMPLTHFLNACPTLTEMLLYNWIKQLEKSRA